MKTKKLICRISIYDFDDITDLNTTIKDLIIKNIHNADIKIDNISKISIEVDVGNPSGCCQCGSVPALFIYEE